MYTPTDSTAVATSSLVAQGSTSVLLLTFYHNAIQLAFPFIIPALILILVDLIFGCSAAKKRGEIVRFSRAVRRTLDKIVSYTCWVILAATLSVAFSLAALNKIILGVVMGIEMISVISNYFEIKGKKVTGLWDVMLKIAGKKLDEDLSDIKIEDINGTETH